MSAIVYVSDTYARAQVCRVLDEAGITVVAAAGDPQRFAHVEYARASVAIIEAMMVVQPDERLMQAWSAHSVAVVAIMRALDRLNPVEILDAGARAVVAAGAPPEELLQAVRAATTGALYVSAPLSELVIGTSVSRRLAGQRRRCALRGLTPREREVMVYVVNGQSDREIAQTLAISIRTVRFHVSSILRKLGRSSRVDLIRYVLGADSDS